MTTINKEGMWIAFKNLGKEALSMNHYDLEACSDADFTADEWRKFLSLSEVKQYVQEEMEIIRTSQMNKIVQDSSTSKSVGQAQLLSALQKLEADDATANGPIFIYCYVPLNDQQEHAPNVLEVDEFGRFKS